MSIIDKAKYLNMKIRVVIFISLFIGTGSLTTAQTLQQGRDYFLQGDYEKAKPIMLKYLKQKPEDASRNFWYGVCCLETGSADESVPYLIKAANKSIIKAYRYLGDYYLSKELYSETIAHYEEFVLKTSQDKDHTDKVLEAQYSTKIDSLKLLFRMIKNTEVVCFIDSLIVSEQEFFKNYLIGKETGSIDTYSNFFEEDIIGDVFLPETGTSLFFSRKDQNGHFKLFQRVKVFNRWEDERPLIGLENSGNSRFPFVENDGITIYYSYNGNGSLGGYDIYASRLNSYTGRYMIPDNIGMPFNSPANDYLYVIDEVNNLGWFATDRNQPEGFVCIYTFIPNRSRVSYKYEGGDTAAIHRASKLISIEETQTDVDAVRSAKQRLALLMYQHNKKENQDDFLFVIDDLNDYHRIEQFQSDDARSLFVKWRDLKKMLLNESERLDQMREKYSNSPNSVKENIREELLILEKQVETMEKQVIDMEIDIRNTELLYFSQ